jgi:hypothetical protein
MQHIKMSEIDGTAASGGLKIDGKIVLPSVPLKDEHGKPMEGFPGVELVTSKAAVEPVWYLPGVAERFGMWVQHSSILRSRLTIIPCLDLKVYFVALCSKIQEGCIQSLLLDPISRSSCHRLEDSRHTYVSLRRTITSPD